MSRAVAEKRAKIAAHNDEGCARCQKPRNAHGWRKADKTGACSEWVNAAELREEVERMFDDDIPSW